MTDSVALFKVLSDPVRFGIVESLSSNGESCACDLLERFTITQPTLSHHMKALCASSLVRSRRVGTWVHYSLDREVLEGLIGTLSGWAEGAGKADGARGASAVAGGACGGGNGACGSSAAPRGGAV